MMSPRIDFKINEPLSSFDLHRLDIEELEMTRS